ncbi:hypothetical protein [Mariprofundus micogutta]|nr:hypothetical protein [Mariprofundus micogutta]
MYWHKALAGAVPAIAADLAVLNIFNIYAQSQKEDISNRSLWWPQLYTEIRRGQAMDPYFRDIYRLTEGLLAFEAGKMEQAVEILAMSEQRLNSSDPLLAASFIAFQELKDSNLAISLAKRASAKPDATNLAIGFSSSLIQKKNGCKLALDFLKSRLDGMPPKYHKGIFLRIERLKKKDECKGLI